VNSRQIQIALASLLVAVVGMGLYAYRLLNRGPTGPAAETRAISLPGSGPQRRAVLMVASDKRAGLERREVEVSLPQDPSLRAQQLIRLLLAAYAAQGSRHLLPKSADVKQVFFLEGDLAVVDMNAAFADEHPSGAQTEQLTLDSIVQTLAANFPQIKRVKILVEGRERGKLAGNADLSTVLTVTTSPEH
jgi:Sporulation and spore germination